MTESKVPEGWTRLPPMHYQTTWEDGFLLPRRDGQPVEPAPDAAPPVGLVELVGDFSLDKLCQTWYNAGRRSGKRGNH